MTTDEQIAIIDRGIAEIASLREINTELLEALKNLCHGGTDQSRAADWRKAEEVIRKAEGKQ